MPPFLTSPPTPPLFSAVPGAYLGVAGYRLPRQPHRETLCRCQGNLLLRLLTLSSLPEIQFERARTSLKDRREGGSWFLCGTGGGGRRSEEETRREKRWCAFWWLYLMARARTCQMRIWPWLKANLLSLSLVLLLLINNKTIRICLQKLPGNLICFESTTLQFNRQNPRKLSHIQKW